MRTAYEKGFNVITLTDCVATTSDEGQTQATTGTLLVLVADDVGRVQGEAGVASTWLHLRARAQGTAHKAVSYI